VVLVKEVPDTYGDRLLDLETGLADRGASERVLDEIGERAIEAAVVLKEADADTEVVLISMGPESVATGLRKGLAMGADRAVHILDDALRGADLTLTAEVLAAAARRESPDLVIAGVLSTDGTGGVMPAMLAEHLGAAHLTAIGSLQRDGARISGERGSDGGTAQVSADLPAVVSITEAMPEARFPNFKGIMAAKKKPFETLSLADLELEASLSTPRSIMISIGQKPSRGGGTVVVDEGDGGIQLAEFLISNKLV
jgi:electron transfer flavoprotein beta subunit